MGRHDQLSDKALSHLLVTGGLVRVTALAGIVLMQVAYPGMSLRLPLSVAALVLVALVIAAELVLRREERRRWREKDERINRVLEDVRHRDRRDR
jgi:O-antigen ligase